MNLIDMRIFSTQLKLYLKTFCHSLTTHINGQFYSCTSRGNSSSTFCRWLIVGGPSILGSIDDFGNKHSRYLIGNIRIFPPDMAILCRQSLTVFLLLLLNICPLSRLKYDLYFQGCKALCVWFVCRSDIVNVYCQNHQ
jgi:hypothetical protein